MTYMGNALGGENPLDPVIRILYYNNENQFRPIINYQGTTIPYFSETTIP